MSYQYMSVSETYDDGRMSCGIAVLVLYDDGSSAVLQTISDICEDKTRIQKLVHQCNQCQLTPDHLPDILEDFLGTL